MAREPGLREVHGGPRGRSGVHLLRRAAVGQRHARHPPRDGPFHQGCHLPLQDPDRVPGPPARRLGHPWPARRTGRGEEARHHQGGHRQNDFRRGVQRHLPQGGDEIYRRMGVPHAADRLLGGHGRPVRHLRQPLCRNPLVPAEGHLRQGPSLQGLHHPALFPDGRHRPEFPRTQPAGLLQGRDGHHRHGPVRGRQGRRLPAPFRDGDPSGLLPGLDHDAVDPPVQHRPLRGPVHRLRPRPFLQPLHGRAGHLRAGGGPRGRLVQPEGGRRAPGELSKGRQGGPVQGAGRQVQGRRPRRHPL